MAQRAAGVSKKPEVVKAAFASVSASDVIRAPASLRAFPLALETVLAPYKKHRKLTLRIERVPQQARLSAGRNNGDGTWSLAPDDVEDLALQAPETVSRSLTLTVRIMAMDGGEVVTLKVVEFPVFAPETVPAKETKAPDDAALEDELAQMRLELAARGSELDEMRRQADAARAGQLKAEAELAALRTAARTELERLTSAASSQASQDIEAARKLWQAEAQLRAAEERARLERDGREALMKAESQWKAGEAARLAALEAQWREQSARMQAEAVAGSEAAEKARAESEARLRADAAALAAEKDRELARLRDAMARQREELLAAQTALAAREGDLMRQRSDGEQARLKMQQDADAALATARAAWIAGEAARLAAAEARWRDQSEAALAQARAQHEAAAEAAADAKARADAALAEARAQREAAERMAADVKAQADIALAQLKARCEAAEQAAAEARARADAARPPEGSEIELAKARDELARQREELAAAHAALATRDSELARRHTDGEAARLHVQQEADAALAAARAAWVNEEAARLAAAEAKWREQSARALAEAAARCETAEAALEQARREKGTRSASDDAYVERLRGEVAALQNVLVAREAELAQARASVEQLRLQSWPDATRSGGDWSHAGIEERAAQRANMRLMRDAVILVAVVMLGVLFWPRLVALMPYELRAAISDMTGQDTAADAVSAPATPAAPPVPAAPVRRTASVGRGVNLRATPSTSGAVVQRLAKGVQVTVGEQRGSWTEVEAAGADGKLRQGWVFSTYLSAGTTTAPEAVTAKAAPARKVQPAAPAAEAPAVGEPAAAPETPASESPAPPAEAPASQ